VIRGITWKHDAVVSVSEAIALLDDLRVTLNRSMDAATQQSQPHVVNVWFESHDPDQPPPPMIAIIGVMKYSAQTAGWVTGHNADELTRTLSRRLGRVLIRFNCNYLFDLKGRAISSSTDVIRRTGSPPLPGGVFESWFWVKG
jgi:hypothetical protein